MKYSYSFFFCVFISFLQFAVNVRVLLSELPTQDSFSVAFSAPNGFTLFHPHQKKKKIVTNRSQLLLTHTDNTLQVNGRAYNRDSICVMPKTGFISYDGKEYDGYMVITEYKGKRLVINVIDIEQYLFSVLHTESWPGWPLEVNKAFAITSRSYVMAMIQRARTSKLPYHIKNSNVHQTYAGVHTNFKLQRAVNHTKGVFLAHDNNPIIAMFDSCCGGVIPAGIADFDFTRAPYLARTYPCTYCKSSFLYEWQATYCPFDLGKRLSDKEVNLHAVRQIKVTKKDDAGLVQEVKIRGAKAGHAVSGTQLYSLLKEIKSFSFSVRKKAGTVTFKGRGYGHHLGLCQWGAREMVRQGKGYRDILSFYYPDTQFMKLKSV